MNKSGLKSDNTLKDKILKDIYYSDDGYVGAKLLHDIITRKHGPIISTVCGEMAQSSSPG